MQMLPAEMPSHKYRFGVSKVLRGLSLPPGKRFRTPREKVAVFVRAVEADVTATHGRINSRHVALIERAKRALRTMLLVDLALRQDKRVLTPEGDVDVVSETVQKLLELERKATDSLSQAMNSLAVPIEAKGDVMAQVQAAIEAANQAAEAGNREGLLPDRVDHLEGEKTEANGAVASLSQKVDRAAVQPTVDQPSELADK